MLLRRLAKDNDLGTASLEQSILQFFQSGADHRDTVDLHQPAGRARAKSHSGDVQKKKKKHSGNNAVNIGK